MCSLLNQSGNVVLDIETHSELSLELLLGNYLNANQEQTSGEKGRLPFGHQKRGRSESGNNEAWHHVC